MRQIHLRMIVPRLFGEEVLVHQRIKRKYLHVLGHDRTPPNHLLVREVHRVAVAAVSTTLLVQKKVEDIAVGVPEIGGKETMRGKDVVGDTLHHRRRPLLRLVARQRRHLQILTPQDQEKEKGAAKRVAAKALSILTNTLENGSK